jgi:hypothetical protein
MGWYNQLQTHSPPLLYRSVIGTVRYAIGVSPHSLSCVETNRRIL